MIFLFPRWDMLIPWRVKEMTFPIPDLSVLFSVFFSIIFVAGIYYMIYIYILFQELYMLAVQGWGIDRVWTLGMYLLRTLPETYRVLSPEEAMCCLQEGCKTFQWPALKKKAMRHIMATKPQTNKMFEGQIFSSWHDLQTCVRFLKVDSPTNFCFRFQKRGGMLKQKIRSHVAWPEMPGNCQGTILWGAEQTLGNLYAHPLNVPSCVPRCNKNLGSIPFQPHVATQQLRNRYTNTFMYYLPIVWNLLPDFSDKTATESTIDSIDASLVKESFQRQDPYSASGFFYVSIISFAWHVYTRLIYIYIHILGHPTTLANGSDHQTASPQVHPIHSSEIMIHHWSNQFMLDAPRKICEKESRPWPCLFTVYRVSYCPVI